MVRGVYCGLWSRFHTHGPQRAAVPENARRTSTGLYRILLLLLHYYMRIIIFRSI